MPLIRYTMYFGSEALSSNNASSSSMITFKLLLSLLLSTSDEGTVMSSISIVSQNPLKGISAPMSKKFLLMQELLIPGLRTSAFSQRQLNLRSWFGSSITQLPTLTASQFKHYSPFSPTGKAFSSPAKQCRHSLDLLLYLEAKSHTLKALISLLPLSLVIKYCSFCAELRYIFS